MQSCALPCERYQLGSVAPPLDSEEESDEEDSGASWHLAALPSHILRAGGAARWQPQERKQGAACGGTTGQGRGGWGFRLPLWRVFATEQLTVRTRRVEEGRWWAVMSGHKIKAC